MDFNTEIGGRKLTITLGEVAGQANGSCLVRYGDTLVLATAVMGEEEPDMDYFPLRVDYEERFYAAGKMKGSRFIKRETRPPTEAILAARLIDRAIRPYFDQSIRRSIQIVITVLSFDGDNDSDLAGLWGACVALTVSDIPWEGPVAGVRVGRVNGELVLNPTAQAKEKSDVDLVICGKDDRVIMLETGAKEIKEADALEAIIRQ